MEALSVALFIAIVAQQVVEAVIRPVKVKWPEVDYWWLIYVTWAVGAGLAWAAQLNLFSQLFVYPMVGQVLSAIVVGGGSQLINSIFGILDTKKLL
jgi:hypothetical protein